MLKDEVALYSKLTGKDGSDVPVGIIGAYLDGYERGKADASETTYRPGDHERYRASEEYFSFIPTAEETKEVFMIDKLKEQLKEKQQNEH